MSQPIIKQPSEIMLCDFDCGNRALAPDEVITGVLDIQQSVFEGEGGTLNFPDSDVTSGHVIQRLVGGGISGVVYKVTFLVSTSRSPVREFDFLVYVYDF